LLRFGKAMDFVDEKYAAFRAEHAAALHFCYDLSYVFDAAGNGRKCVDWAPEVLGNELR
jgi:hypothetical protein